VAVREADPNFGSATLKKHGITIGEAPAEEKPGFFSKLGSGVESFSKALGRTVEPGPREEVGKNLLKNVAAQPIGLAQMAMEPIDKGLGGVVGLAKGAAGLAMHNSQHQDNNPLRKEGMAVAESMTKFDPQRPLDQVFNVAGMANPSGLLSKLARVQGGSKIANAARSTAQAGVKMAHSPEALPLRMAGKAAALPTKIAAGMVKKGAAIPMDRPTSVMGQKLDLSKLDNSPVGANSKTVGEFGASEALGFSTNTSGNTIRQLQQGVANDPSGRAYMFAVEAMSGSPKSKDRVVRRAIKGMDRYKGDLSNHYEALENEAFGALPQGSNTRVPVNSLQEAAKGVLENNGFPSKTIQGEPNLEVIDILRGQLPESFVDRSRSPDSFKAAEPGGFGSGQMSGVTNQGQAQRVVQDVFNELFKPQGPVKVKDILQLHRNLADTIPLVKKDISAEAAKILTELQQVTRDHLHTTLGPRFSEAADLYSEGRSFINDVDDVFGIRPGQAKSNSKGKFFEAGVRRDEVVASMVEAVRDASSEGLELMAKIEERGGVEHLRTTVAGEAMSGAMGTGLQPRAEMARTGKMAAARATKGFSVGGNPFAAGTGVGGSLMALGMITSGPLAAVVGGLAGLPVSILFSPKLVGSILADISDPKMRGQAKQALANAKLAGVNAKMMGINVSDMIKTGAPIAVLLEKASMMDQRVQSRADSKEKQDSLLGAIGRSRNTATAQATR